MIYSNRDAHSKCEISWGIAPQNHPYTRSFFRRRHHRHASHKEETFFVDFCGCLVRGEKRKTAQKDVRGCWLLCVLELAGKVKRSAMGGREYERTTIGWPVSRYNLMKLSHTLATKGWMFMNAQTGRGWRRKFYSNFSCRQRAVRYILLYRTCTSRLNLFRVSEWVGGWLSCCLAPRLNANVQYHVDTRMQTIIIIQLGSLTCDEVQSSGCCCSQWDASIYCTLALGWTPLPSNDWLSAKLTWWNSIIKYLFVFLAHIERCAT